MPADPAILVLATGNPHKVEELRAILAACGNERINILGLTDLPPPIHAQLREPEEHGTTFEENARIKALSYAAQIASLSNPDSRFPKPDSRFLCLADDSGLEIDALRSADGTPRPGVISSHYSTDGRETGLTRPERDAANNARVLRELEGVPPEQRTARFVCCMCLALGTPPVPGGPSSIPNSRRGPAGYPNPIPSVLHETRGTMEGRIIAPPHVPAGNNGFGYDPLFLVAAAPFNFTKTAAELTSGEKNALSHRGAAARAMADWLRRLGS